MRTHLTEARTTVRPAETRATTLPQKVVIVNGSPEMLALVETAFDVGNYSLVFLDSNGNAYSEIKRMRPNLVIICTRLENLDGFQVLSMLKLDRETEDIPVVTFTTEEVAQEAEDEAIEAEGLLKNRLN